MLFTFSLLCYARLSMSNYRPTDVNICLVPINPFVLQSLVVIGFKYAFTIKGSHKSFIGGRQWPVRHLYHDITMKCNLKPIKPISFECETPKFNSLLSGDWWLWLGFMVEKKYKSTPLYAQHVPNSHIFDQNIVLIHCFILSPHAWVVKLTNLL